MAVLTFRLAYYFLGPTSIDSLKQLLQFAVDALGKEAVIAAILGGATVLTASEVRQMIAN